MSETINRGPIINTTAGSLCPEIIAAVEAIGGKVNLNAVIGQDISQQEGWKRKPQETEYKIAA